MMKKLVCFVFYIAGILPITVQAQFFLISPVHRPVEDTMAVYSILIRNTVKDSMLVLHSQETQLPPFINNYRYEIIDSTGIVVFLGKSTNPLIPETYRATKPMKSRSKLEIYFSVPKSQVKLKKTIDIWYSLIDQKYIEAFHRLELMENNYTVERCRKLKEKYGVVYHKVLSY